MNMTEEKPKNPPPHDVDRQFIEAMEKALDDGKFEVVKQHEARLRNLIARIVNEARESVRLGQSTDDEWSLYKQACEILHQYSSWRCDQEGITVPYFDPYAKRSSEMDDDELVAALEKAQHDRNHEYVEQNEAKLRRLVYRLFDEREKSPKATELHKRASEILRIYNDWKYWHRVKDSEAEFNDPCMGCGRPWGGSVGCACVCYIIEGQIIRRIPVGEDTVEYGHCSECGAAPGRYHYMYCTREQCPLCGGRVTSCECDGGFAHVSPPDPGGTGGSDQSIGV